MPCSHFLPPSSFSSFLFISLSPLCTSFFRTFDPSLQVLLARILQLCGQSTYLRPLFTWLPLRLYQAVALSLRASKTDNDHVRPRRNAASQQQSSGHHAAQLPTTDSYDQQWKRGQWQRQFLVFFVCFLFDVMLLKLFAQLKRNWIKTVLFQTYTHTCLMNWLDMAKGKNSMKQWYKNGGHAWSWPLTCVLK